VTDTPKVKILLAWIPIPFKRNGSWGSYDATVVVDDVIRGSQSDISPAQLQDPEFVAELMTRLQEISELPPPPHPLDPLVAAIESKGWTPLAK